MPAQHPAPCLEDVCCGLIENAIDAMNGHGGIMLPGGDGPQQLTNEMRAVLWQLFTGSKSAKNNPYSERVGSQVIAEREKTKQED